MEYFEESTQVFTDDSKIWIRKRTDPMIYIIFFFASLALAFTSYWPFISISIGALFIFYSIKKDLILDFSKKEISTSLRVTGFLFPQKRFQLNDVMELAFRAELMDDEEGTIYKPFMYYLHILTKGESYKTACYFEDKESVAKFRNLVKTYDNSIKIQLDMNGLEDAERQWNGE